MGPIMLLGDRSTCMYANYLLKVATVERPVGGRVRTRDLSSHKPTPEPCYIVTRHPPNNYIREPYGNNMGLNVVPIWVSPTGCLVRLLKGFCWDLYGSRDEAAQKGTT